MTTARFPWAHATHPDWRMSASLCLAQIEQTRRGGATLGILYLTDRYAQSANDILAFLRDRTGITHWAGAIGLGVMAGMAEYIDEPAMALMLADIAPDDFQVFSGNARPPRLDARTPDGARSAWTALVHADASAPDLPDLVRDMADKLASGVLVGGVSSSRQPQSLIADAVLAGGLTGVVLSENVALATCLCPSRQPVRPVQRVPGDTGRLQQQRDRDTARGDLVRACTELRDTVEGMDGGMSRVRGVIYISCLARTGVLFGGPSAEMQLVHQQLGELPLIGFYANGELFQDQSHRHAGVLIAFL